MADGTDFLRALGWNGKRIDEFVSSKGTIDAVAKDSAKKIAASPIAARELERYRLAREFGSWVEKRKEAKKFVDVAGPYEFKVAKNENPFYPMIGFGVPFDACLDLGVPCKREIMAYAVAYAAVVQSGIVSVQDVTEILKKRNLQDVDVTVVDPFPSFGRVHPLRQIDTDVVPPAEAMRIVPSRWGGVYGLREKSRMRNVLTIQGDRYVVVSESNRNGLYERVVDAALFKA